MSCLLASSAVAASNMQVTRSHSLARGTTVDEIQKAIATRGATEERLEQLGWAFVTTARRDPNPVLYRQAMEVANEIETRFGATPASLLLRGHVWYNQHHFAKAETVARRLVAERGAPFDHALLSDALMEQGKLAEAVTACQQFVNARPGLESYSRVAHLRWLHGDLTGAVVSMEEAVRAASIHIPEPRAWALTQLSSLYLRQGRVDAALAAADRALELLPGYASGLFARGRILFALDREEDALSALAAATQLDALPEHQWWQADVLRSCGRESEARQVETELLKRGGRIDPRTTALFLATNGRSLDLARQLATRLSARQQDMFTQDALAWTLAMNGELEAAAQSMAEAMAHQTPDARLLLHAAIIARRQGNSEKAGRLIKAALPLAATLTPSEQKILRHFLEPHPATAENGAAASYLNTNPSKS